MPLTISCSSPPEPMDWPVAVQISRRSLRPETITESRGLRLTKRPLTALIAAVQLREGSVFLDRMLQIREVSLGDLERAVEQAAGMHGIVEARKLVKVASSDSESEAERLFVRLLRNRGIGGWVQQFRCGRWRFDFAWPEQRVAVEISGWEFHRYHDRHAADMDKANYLQKIKWRELQFDWHMLNESGEARIQEVVDMLNAQGAGEF